MQGNGEKNQFIRKWSTQMRKGYFELCVIRVLRKKQRAYGFELIPELESLEISIKEGTLYPLLSRMEKEGLVKSAWEINGGKRPRKYYSLSPFGTEALKKMQKIFFSMEINYKKIARLGDTENERKNDQPISVGT